MNIVRRDFLKVGLFTAGTLSAGRLWGNIGNEPMEDPPWEGPPGEEKHVFSVCQMCPNGCGIRVRVYEGRAVKIEGNRDHPMNRGGICPRGQAALQLLYHPQRLKYPIVKKGGGADSWQRLTYEEALGVVGQKLNDLLRNRSTHHLVAANAGTSDLDDILLKRFCAAIGSPNYLRYESLGRKSMSMAMGLTHGIFVPPTIDWENCNYLMLFGAEPGATDVSPMWSLKSFGRLRRGRAGRRAKIVHVSTRHTPFSSKIDEWVGINPGTYGALALGMAHVIISEEKYDLDFIDTRTLGFRETLEIDGTRRPGFKDHVLENYTPEVVSGITGVPAETIVRLSEEFAEARPGVAYGGDGPASYTNAVTELVAIHALNALVGSIDVPGGVMIQRTPRLKIPQNDIVNPLFANNLKQERVDGSRDVSGLPVHPGTSGLTTRLTESSPYPVKMMFLSDFNPVARMPDSKGWERALKEIPFVVSFSNFLDETSRFADLVIPTGIFLEKWDGKTVDSSTGFGVFGLSRPVVEPRFAQIGLSEFLIRLAEKMGSGMEKSFPWKSSEALLKEMVSDLNTRPGESDPWSELTGKGFWSEGPYSFGHQRDVFNTRGNRFYFFMYGMERAGRELFEMGHASPGSTTDGLASTDFLPNHIPPELDESGRDYPLDLEIFGTTVSGHGHHGFLDCLSEIRELDLEKSWDKWVLLSRRTARRFGLTDDDKVMVKSARGSIAGFIKVLDGMPDETAGLIFGQGRRIDVSENGPGSEFSLLPDSQSIIGGGVCWNGAKVNITRI
jgi:anaerobic selenocysteine-containing dehydrogenase